MGSSASKASRAATKSAAETTRRYPAKPSPRAINPITPSKTGGTTPMSRTEKSGPRVYPDAYATGRKGAEINLDTSDPDLALNARMRKLGPVHPNPTMSNSSTFNRPQNYSNHGPHVQNIPQNHSNQPTPSQPFSPSPSSPMQTLFPNPVNNPAVTLLAARKRIIEEAEAEFEEVGRQGTGRKGRRFLDVGLVRKILVLRDKGMGGDEIERVLGLEGGVVGRLGERGVVGIAN